MNSWNAEKYKSHHKRQPSTRRVVPKAIAAEFASKHGIPSGLVGFPKVIRYFGERCALTIEGALQAYRVSYLPQYGTYGQNGQLRYLSYRSELGGVFSVIVTVDCHNGRTDVFKRAGQRLVSHVFGENYQEALSTALSEPLHRVEPAVPVALPAAAGRRERGAQQKWAATMSAQYDENPEKLFLRTKTTLKRSAKRSFVAKTKTMFYGELPGRSSPLVFVPAPQAERLRRIQTAMKARTWGEFRRKMPDRDYALILENLRDDWKYKTFQEYVTEQRQDGITLPRSELWESYKNSAPYLRPPLAEDRFKPQDVPGFCDGDWPPWPQQCMLSWLPREAVQLGTRNSSVLNGDFLEISGNVGLKVIDILRQKGFTCVYRPDLISFVSGCGWPDGEDEEQPE